MQLAIATQDERTAQAQAVCELCVQIMGSNFDTPDQIIGICPDCQSDIPE
jgi:hypothetical protein